MPTPAAVPSTQPVDFGGAMAGRKIVVLKGFDADNGRTCKPGEDVTAEAMRWPNLGVLIKRRFLGTDVPMSDRFLKRLRGAPIVGATHHETTAAPTKAEIDAAVLTPPHDGPQPGDAPPADAGEEPNPALDVMLEKLKALSAKDSADKIRKVLVELGAAPTPGASKAQLLSMKDDMVGELQAV